MRRLALILGFSLLTTLVFGQELSTDEKRAAQAQIVDGIVVFTDCEPVAEYNVVGDIKSAGGACGQYTCVRDKLIKKALKEYDKSFDGIIIYPAKNGVDKATVIKFKAKP